jgi:hypothetical protein
MKTKAWSAVLLLLLAPTPEFHQGIDYVIEAQLDETTNVLTGRAEVRYTNRSPNSLDTLFFHLYLNAFRPNSAWATRELQIDRRRFQDLGPDDHAYDRITAVTVNGRRVRPRFPFAPDSTVMAVRLRSPLPPKGVALITFDWTSRLATVPRRQGRQGRHYDWAHWYPRIAVYDTSGWQIQPLLPQGEFFGEFASYDVTLDVAADQVLGATGVPVSGDPGWKRVNATKEVAPIMKRTAYRPRPARALGLLAAIESGRKRIRWRAEQVHHFAWTADPNFIYEGSQLGDVALHALYLPGDTLWPSSVINTMKSSIQFYDSIFGPYLYPQLTSARRLDTGGTEFPMITMNATNPPIVHETGHQWAHAMLANNEFREFWLDEGLVFFLGGMYAEAAGRSQSYGRNLIDIARLDSLGASQPVALAAAEFRNFTVFQAMSYIKAALVLRMLRWYLGDETFRRGLRLYYKQNKLEHVDENDLRRAMSEAAGEKLDWFFHQWLHTTGTLDYGIAHASKSQLPNGEWRTQIEITRSGGIWMPVDLRVGAATRRLDSREQAYTIVMETKEEPTDVELDPEQVLIDIAQGNNRLEIQGEQE